MSSFDHAQHPRGNESTGHAGQFATKQQSSADIDLSMFTDSQRYAISTLDEIGSTISERFPNAADVEYSYSPEQDSYTPSNVYDHQGRPVSGAIEYLRADERVQALASSELDSYELLDDLSEIGQLEQTEDGQYFYRQVGH